MPSEINPEVIKDFLTFPKTVKEASDRLAEDENVIVILGHTWAIAVNVKDMTTEREAAGLALKIVRENQDTLPPLPVSPDDGCERFAWLWFPSGSTLDKPAAASTTALARQGKPIRIDGVDVYLRERD